MTMTNKKETAAAIKVLLVDDQDLLRQGLKMWMALASDIQIIGEASDGQVALRLASELHPDVVVMDIEMPRLDGISATAALHAATPEVAVIMLSIYGDPAIRAKALAAGAAAFIEKTGGALPLLDAIRRVGKKERE
jgi:DNA-binding NarL/FixJ family response regulator